MISPIGEVRVCKWAPSFPSYARCCKKSPHFFLTPSRILRCAKWPWDREWLEDRPTGLIRASKRQILVTISWTPLWSPSINQWGCLSYRPHQLAGSHPNILHNSPTHTPNPWPTPYAHPKGKESEPLQAAGEHVRKCGLILSVWEKAHKEHSLPPQGKQTGGCHQLAWCYWIKRRHILLRIPCQGGVGSIEQEYTKKGLK